SRSCRECIGKKAQVSRAVRKHEEQQAIITTAQGYLLGRDIEAPNLERLLTGVVCEFGGMDDFVKSMKACMDASIAEAPAGRTTLDWFRTVTKLIEKNTEMNRPVDITAMSEGELGKMIEQFSRLVARQQLQQQGNKRIEKIPE